MFPVLIIETDIVPVISCGCEIWSLMSKEGNRLKIIESMVVRRIFDVRGRYEQRDVEDCGVSCIIVTLQEILM